MEGDDSFEGLSDLSSSLDLVCEIESDSDDSEVSGSIKPYRYEPESNEQTEESVMSPEATLTMDRRQNTNWCQCGLCECMAAAQESVCCREQEQVSQKMPDSANCITEHKNFDPVCLNEDVLEVAYSTYQQHSNLDDGNNWKRYTAYRQFIRWCYGYLGMKVRVPIPACVVNKIRHSFPLQEGQEYVSLRFAD
ncbi:P2X purinoceptor 7-like isoform X1 [Ciona intestinalis]